MVFLGEYGPETNDPRSCKQGPGGPAPWALGPSVGPGGGHEIGKGRGDISLGKPRILIGNSI